MSFSGFGKSSGPSIPPTTQKTFGSASAFPWIPPISNPNLPTVSAIIQKVDQEPLHQLIPSPTKTFDSSFNKLARQRISSPHSDLSHNMLDHTNSKFVAQHDATSITGKPAYLVTPKRARSPIESDENPLHSLSALPDSEREKQAKAKRLARFHTELTQPLQNLQDLTRGKPIGNKRNQISLFQQKDGEHAENTTFGGSLLDPGGAESTKAVIGLCPDMCPELERDERERKGDLDKHERLNGDRNQTSKFIAVKKYNRLAEREAELIRPMPVLLKTVDYLLSLLDQPYDGNFLYLYNFLWDRMRAVRMDLRMQHIFNEDAILLLEQMIRLHVIAMHELCEFEKGEGFTEGFDAHLNIEQMNKTSVELFQLYDDHRKQGKSFASEKEFRGYYALLKLDKHPGYKVEPAELSLDLAKMAPEIRSSPEILFARDVARACRIGNYVSFFRLARKATYLQACLMHAHFSKLRKQALDSLHSGLQNNQGVPIAHVEKWLAMEGEDVVGLLEYHGFSIRKYEEAYMVKEGPFLSSDVDFPTRCAQLVQHKRSKYIVSDVRSTLTLERHSAEKECPNSSVDIFDHRNFVKTGIQLAAAYDEIMSDNIIRSAPTVITVPSGLFEEKLPFIPNRESKVKLAEMPVVMEAFVPPVGRIGGYAQQDGSQQIVYHGNKDLFNEATSLVLENNKNQPAVHESLSSSSHTIYENLTSKESENQKLESDSLPPLLVQQEIARKEVLKRIVRKWKRQAASRRRNREQEIYLAGTALSSLSLGPPIVQIESQTWSSENFDIEAITRARFGKYDHSWSRLNISDLVFPIMTEKNPSARCICWKLVLLVQPVASDNQIYLSATDWLFFKLLGPSTFHDADLVACLPGLSIWKKWSDPCKTSPSICCLSIVRGKVLDDHQIERDVLYGADCLVYLVSETIPWGVQQARLQNVLASIPPASNFPLLILSALSPSSAVSPSSEAAEGSLEIIKRLALNEEKRNMRTHPSSVIFLAKNSCLNGSHGFFDDDQLRMGLQWLANNVPSAPLLRPIRTRQLVLNHLREYINAASKQKEFDVAPNDCIAVFNKALDESANEIIASMDPAAHWPAPEIYLVHAASEEGILAGQCFPTAGWNSPTRINAIIQAIESCKLPSFPCTSRLEHEPFAGERIRQQASVLEELLVHFLNGLNGLLKADAAALESSYMLQHCVGLRQCELGYCLAPRWMFIFQRIYSWQLNRLMAPGITDAYVKDGGALNDLCLSIHSLFSDVTLDELIELSCSNNPFERRPVLGAIARDSKGGDGTVARTDVRDDENLRCSSPSFVLHMNADRQTEATPIASSCERLTMLLEQCNRLQDKIDQKMAIYF